MWLYLGLPEPTPVQYDIAYYLQHGEQRTIIQAFRGCGKSWITSAYVIWLLYWNPDEKIMVVSSGNARAEEFTQFVLKILSDWDAVSHLNPRADQRRSLAKFDVNGCKHSHAPSVKSVGITGQMVGSRATVIIPDDVESPKNSLTQTQREKLKNLVNEFESILSPGAASKIRYLGTPQVNDSLYNVLDEVRDDEGNKVYHTRIWPSRIPENIGKYNNNLAPMIYQMIEDGMPYWTPTDPTRFDDKQLKKPEATYGKSGFALQFQLDTSLDDSLKFPLKCSDIIVMDTDSEIAPVKVSYGSTKNELLNLDCVGMHGDRWYSPGYKSVESIEYQDSVMYIDPSGRGKDHTGYAVVKYLNGYLYVTRAGGLKGGYDPQTLTALAMIAKSEEVNMCLIESNYGDGMYTELFKPVLQRLYKRCAIEEDHVSGQKELRIIDTLEPIMNQHKLVFNKGIVEADMKRDTNRQLFFQMTRITKERNSLVHDDELDALAGAVKYFIDKLNIDTDSTEDRHKEELFDKDLEEWMRDHGGVQVASDNFFSRV